MLAVYTVCRSWAGKFCSVLVVGFVCISCTFEVPGGVDEFVDVPKGVNKLPLRVGAYYSPEFKNYRQKETAAFYHKLDFKLGEWSLNHFEKIFREQFQTVETVERRPPQLRGPYDAVIEPRIERVSIRDPGMFGWAGTHHVSISYLFILYSMDGNILATWSVDGKGTNKNAIDWTGFAGSDNAAEAVQKALNEAGTNFLKTFETQPEIERWLNSRAL